jgi:hypothetical protein
MINSYHFRHGEEKRINIKIMRKCGCMSIGMSVYANTHPISFLWFVAKGNMGCTHGDQSFLQRYMLQQVECW